MQRFIGFRSADQAAYQGLQQVKCKRHGFRLARGITWVTRGGHNYLGMAPDYECARGSTGKCTVATVRTGVAWSSLVRWLVILMGGSEWSSIAWYYERRDLPEEHPRKG